MVRLETVVNSKRGPSRASRWGFVSVTWKPARRIRPAMRRRVRVIVNVCAQCAFVCVCARVRVWLASAGMLLCAPSSIPHCGVCTTAA